MQLLIAAAVSITAVAGAQDVPSGDLIPIDHFAIGNRSQGVPAVNAALDYSNVVNFLGQAFPNGGAANQAGNGITRLVADDITPTGANAGLDVIQISFSVANLNAGAVSARARVRFWFDSPGAPGAYYNNPANVGFSFNPFLFQPGVTVLTGTIAANLFKMPGTTFWAGVTFDNNTGTTGATLAQLSNLGQGVFDPPDIGSSADIAFQTTAAGSFFPTSNPAGATFNFSGVPVANFGWEFLVDTPITPVARSSWGRIKGLYR